MSADGTPPEYYPLRWKVADAAEDLWALHRAKLFVAALALLVGAGAIYFVTTRDDSSSTETADQVDDANTDPTGLDSGVPLADDPATDDDPGDTASTTTSTTEAPTTTTEAPATTSTSTTTTTVSPRLADAETVASTEAGAVIQLTTSQVRLVGGLPNDAVADETVTLAAAMFPDAEIVDEQIVDPSFSTPDVVTFRLSAPDLFGYNSDQLNAAYLPLIDQIAAAMVAADEWSVEVSGHTDDTGPSDGNQRLSEGRAQSAANRLVAQGVSSGRITVVGRGEEQPIADNGSEAGRLANRRVEFAITR